MTRHETLAVAVRLFAVALVLLTLRDVPATILALNQTPTNAGFVIVVASHIAVILVAVGLWKFPFGVAALLLPQHASEAPGLPWSQKQAIETASIVIGFFYAFYALSDLLYWITYGVAVAALDEVHAPPLTADQWAGTITTVAEVVMALTLIFGASGVARFIQAIRYAGKLPSN